MSLEVYPALNNSGKFNWGVNIDDMWKYAGVAAPRSIVVPHVLTTRTRTGTFRLPQPNLTTASSSYSVRSSSLYLRLRSRAKVSTSTADLNASLASYLTSSGIDFVRCWFPWIYFEKYVKYREPAPGQDPAENYQFPLDDFVSKMTDAGISIIAVLGNGYSRFLPFSLQSVDNLSEYLKRLTESSTVIVRHYKDKIKMWQIENEPNWWKAHYAGHWRKGSVWLDAKNQEPILEALYNVVRTESPDAKIIVNLEADSKDTDWKLYARYCDILGLDFYPNYKQPLPSDANVISENSTAARRATGLPIFVIETGYPTGPKLLGYNETNQAKYVHTACSQAFSCDAIEALGWFRFSDSYWSSFPSHENHFGLLTKTGNPKPGWIQYMNEIKHKR